ncbi:MAG: aspartate ammonia-lyase, partial [Deltaproteobacteria bacterium]|nr:aspartate ammonia-lyase [Deltaproteobacteria bacterium]
GDATPVRLGQVFGGFASQIDHGIARLMKLEDHLSELALGGTAVGTGINAHPEFAPRTIAGISHETGLNFREAADHFEAQSAKDAVVEASGALKTVAVSLIKIANDIRFLGSGPRCGIGEIKLPAVQPGSSIMPGKVNPVIPEMLIQICAQVIGNDAAIAFGGAFANFELNTMMPVMAYNLIQSIELLAKGCDIFGEKCVAGIEADAEKCANGIEKSLAMATPLAAIIGYDRAAGIAKKAFESGRTVREIALDEKVLDPVKLGEILDPVKLV